MTYDAAGNLTNDTYTGLGNRTYDAENKIVSAWGGNNQAQLYNYDASGQRIKRTVDGVEIWQIYGFGGELLAEYPANGAPASPQKEYGYRNGQLLVTLDSASGVNGYSYRRAITIDHTKVPNTDRSNFPILISGTYSYLATVANGGNVQNASGYDVIFTSDSGCATKLDHEVETYSASTGAVNYWVKVPTVSHTSDTTIYLCYGNSSITTDQSNKSGVWDANYKGVWHLSNGTTLNASDSTTNGNNGTISGATATAGHNDGGASLNGTSDHIQVKAGKVDTSTSSGTVSAWVKISALDSNGVVLGYGGAAASGGALWGLYIRQVSGSYYFAVAARTTNGGAYNTVKGGTALAAGTWYYVTYSTNGSTWKIRVNGATAEMLTNVLGTNTGDWIGDIAPGTPDKSELGAIYCEGAYSSVNFWHGLLDEVRLSNVERSDDWVTTEYNNQSSPATFYTIGGSAGTSATSVHWLITDHLGTPRMILDQTGTQANVKRHDYLPFGEELFAPAAGRTAALGYTSGDGVRQQFTGKERDVETGLDYFGARYYASAQGRFTSIDPMLPNKPHLVNPQRWNLYSYTANNPLMRLDPDGRNWFDIDGKWEWHKGSKYTDSEGHKYKSNYTHLLVFQKTGTNAEGAATGTLYLYKQNKLIAWPSTAFSGGHGLTIIPNGTYTINLTIAKETHGDSSVLKPGNPAHPEEGRELRQVYGLQEIPDPIYDEAGNGLNGRWEWGSRRAALNEPNANMPVEYRGNYLHGKERPGDYTHGCICDRSEQTLDALMLLNSREVPTVPVWVTNSFKPPE
jgi:RHS repeat-associated protein